MPYYFTFDLSHIPKSFFREVAKVVYKKKFHLRIGEATRHLLRKFNICQITGLNISEAVTILEDFINIQVTNLSRREDFRKTERRALFLPHCARKYMDNRCQSAFNQKMPSYICSHCSSDCLIHQATILGEEKGYDVYVLPGGSCIPHILEKNRYGGIIGVACGEEVRQAIEYLDAMELPLQAIPLLKNGCSNTSFNLETLRNLMN